MKTTGPMFSLAASGTIGGIITASNWKGRSYFRTRVTPANPKSPAQTSNRSVMKFLSQTWASLGAAEQATWEATASALAVSPFNAFVKSNLTAWRNFLPPGTEYPILRTDTAGTVTTPVPTAGIKQISIDIDISVLAQNFGQAIFAKLGAAPTGISSEVIGMVYQPSLTNVTFIHGPLTTGDVWHYKTRPFSLLGNWGTISADSQATVL